jgi:hypothetical protein
VQFFGVRQAKFEQKVYSFEANKLKFRALFQNTSFNGRRPQNMKYRMRIRVQRRKLCLAMCGSAQLSLSLIVIDIVTCFH